GTCGVKPSEFQVTTAANMSRCEPESLMPLGQRGLFGHTQACRNSRFWPATSEPVTSAPPGPHRPVFEVVSSGVPAVSVHAQMCCDLNHSVEYPHVPKLPCAMNRMNQLPCWIRDGPSTVSAKVRPPEPATDSISWWLSPSTVCPSSTASRTIRIV